MNYYTSAEKIADKAFTMEGKTKLQLVACINAVFRSLSNG